jgi:hypothetical protein
MRRAEREAGFVSVPELVVLFAVAGDAVLCVHLTGSVVWGLLAWVATLVVTGVVFLRDVRS